MPDSTKRPFLIGLTGGIASGKSLVSGLFAELGVKVIDTDLIARALVEPGQPGLAAICDAFGPGILDQKGALNRGELSKLIFADGQARERLNAILHPLIRTSMLDKVAKAKTEPYLILVIPLLKETGQETLVDRVLLVDCPVEEQESRLMERNGIDLERARAMIAAQASRQERQAIAHDILNNPDQNTLDRLEDQVARLHRHYLELAQRPKNPSDL